jgi:hypothetical protein
MTFEIGILDLPYSMIRVICRDQTDDTAAKSATAES